MATLVIASRNRGKLQELQAFLNPLGVEVKSVAEFLDGDIEETGATFAANALIKARACLAASSCLSLADDSGLQVDALDGAPGVFSARWAGEGVSDAGRNQLLLDRLQGVPNERRTAQFVSVLAVCHPDGSTFVGRGEVLGVIAHAPRGASGFGYDPLFYFPTLGKTMGELSPVEKSRHSHRARAIERALPAIDVLLKR